MQRVTKNLDLGTEMVLQYGRNVPNNRVAFYSAGWRYHGPMWQFSGALNPSGSLNLCYHQRSTSPIQFGVELETNLRNMESSGTFCYQVDLEKVNMSFKGKTKLATMDFFSQAKKLKFLILCIGMVDSNWNCGAVLEKRLVPMPFTFVLSGYLNHVKCAYKFGIGLNIG